MSSIDKDVLIETLVNLRRNENFETLFKTGIYPKELLKTRSKKILNIYENKSIKLNESSWYFYACKALVKNIPPDEILKRSPNEFTDKQLLTIIVSTANLERTSVLDNEYINQNFVREISEIVNIISNDINQKFNSKNNDRKKKMNEISKGSIIGRANKLLDINYKLANDEFFSPTSGYSEKNEYKIKNILKEYSNMAEVYSDDFPEIFDVLGRRYNDAAYKPEYYVGMIRNSHSLTRDIMNILEKRGIFDKIYDKNARFENDSNGEDIRNMNDKIKKFIINQIKTTERTNNIRRFDKVMKIIPDIKTPKSYNEKSLNFVKFKKIIKQKRSEKTPPMEYKKQEPETEEADEETEDNDKQVEPTIKYVESDAVLEEEQPIDKQEEQPIDKQEEQPIDKQEER